jgi:hypothetical protein
MKICSKCKKIKLFADFHKDKTHADGYRSFCKLCVSTYQHNYNAANKDKNNARVVAWIEANRARHNAKCNRWAKANPDKVNARTARRYAAKTQATPKWLSSDENWMIVEAYDLAKLRARVLGGKWEVDHIVPLRGRGVMGLHVPWNLRVVPMTQNRRKSNILDTAT